MVDLSAILTGEKETINFAQQLAPLIAPPFKIYFSGEIGAGKSCFVRAFLQASGVSCRIKSPTFSIIEHYPVNSVDYLHIDLYRVTDADEIHYLGLDDYDNNSAVILIEWPEKSTEISKPDLYIKLLSMDFGQKRKISIQSMNRKGEKVLAALNLS